MVTNGAPGTGDPRFTSAQSERKRVPLARPPTSISRNIRHVVARQRPTCRIVQAERTGRGPRSVIVDRCSRYSDHNDPISLDVNSKVAWWLADPGNVAGHSRIFAISPASTNVKTQCRHCEIPDMPGRWFWRVIDLRWGAPARPMQERLGVSGVCLLAGVSGAQGGSSLDTRHAGD